LWIITKYKKVSLSLFSKKNVEKVKFIVVENPMGKLQLIENLIRHYQFQKAQEILQNIDPEDEILESEKAQYNILRSQIAYQNGEYQKAITYADIALQGIGNLKQDLRKVDAYLSKARALLWFDEYDQVKSNIDLAREILNAKLEYNEKEQGLRKLHLASILTDYYWTLGNFDELNNSGRDYLELSKTYGNTHDIASGYLNMGLYYGETGNLDKAIENYQKCLDLSLEANDLRGKRSASTALNNIGENYRLKGDLAGALKYYNECLNISKELDEKGGMAISYHNIGLVYAEMGKNSLSFENLLKGLEINREIGNNFEVSRSIFDIINVQADHAEIATLHSLLTELATINQKEHNIRINYRYQIANAVVLKNSGRSRDIYKAEEIMYELIKDESIENELLIIILLHLCDLLFQELHITFEAEIVEEIAPLTDKLLKVAQKGKSFLLFAEFYYFRSKLNLLQLDIIEAQKNLTKAERIAREYGLSRLEQKISFDHDDLLKKMEIWEELAEKHAPIPDRLKLLSLENDLKILMKKEELKSIVFHPEEPLLLSIISKSGTSLFTHVFHKDWEDKGLFSSFMSAFNYFSNEFFSKTLDRIKIGENIIILSPIHEYIFCYVIKGHTFPALKRMDRLIKEVKQSPKILEMLDHAQAKNIVLTNENFPPFKAIFTPIFQLYDEHEEI
jgi:tetratricopeptide (TPR) repeat protein